jgi:NADPH2:quinone reductase
VVPAFDLREVMTRRLTITGSTLRPRSVQEKAAIAESLKQNVWPLLESGKIKVVIDSVFPIDDVANAHRVMEESKHIGKILLKVS